MVETITAYPSWVFRELRETSLAEHVEPSARSMLLRTCAGPILSDNAWNADLLSTFPALQAYFM
jgi:hypothetical protein